MPKTLVSAVRQVACRAPEAIALEWRAVRWTYRDLMDATDRVSGVLTAAGLEPCGRVALLLRNSPQYVAAYYGVMAAGAVAVPLNAQERAPVLARQIEHSGASVLIGDPAHPEWASLRGAVAERVAVVELTLCEDAGALDRLAADLAAARLAVAADVAPPAPADLAAIIYTSGTTGRPKGVMLSAENLLANAEAIASYLRLTPDDRGLCVLPFHFSYGNSVLNSHLLAGARLVLDDNLAYPHLTLRRIGEAGITGFAGVPSTFALLLGRCNLQEFDLRSLRYLTQAGGAMPLALIERLRSELPWAELFVMYGQTEATARITYLPPERLPDKAGSVGLPVPGVEIQIRSATGPVAAGEVGEVHVRGPNVMLGYWRDPEATAAALRDGWLATGDLGRLDDEGFLYLEGRLVDMIKVGAYRVSPLEVEEALATLPGVQEVAVVGIADPLLGQAVKAVIVPRPDAALDVRQVKAHCRAQLASYKVPKEVELVSELPRTASGKVQRFQLA
ncbi:MAG TPA: class I adenylate-forming enzyme family protein [Pseudomonadales bacterium]